MEYYSTQAVGERTTHSHRKQSPGSQGHYGVHRGQPRRPLRKTSLASWAQTCWTVPLSAPPPPPIRTSQNVRYGVRRCGLVAQSCPTLCDAIGRSPPGSSSMGFSKQETWSGVPPPPLGTFQPRDGAGASHTGRSSLTTEVLRSPKYPLQPLRMHLPLFSKEGLQTHYHSEQAWTHGLPNISGSSE